MSFLFSSQKPLKDFQLNSLNLTQSLGKYLFAFLQSPPTEQQNMLFVHAF